MFKILIADDVDNNRRAIKLSLSDLEETIDLEFLEATNGKEAVEVAKSQKPDMIFMDVMMPEMDGVEASEIIKNDPETEEIFILAITALDDYETKKKMINAGVKDFLTKPFDDHELLIRTRNYLELIEAKRSSRNHQTQKSTITLYKDDKSIKSFRIVFKINNESNLIDFWEFFDSYNSFDKAQITDQVNLIVTVTKVLMKANKISSFDIIIEESEDNAYITIWNKTFVEATKKYFEKFSYDISFLEENEKLSFKTEKIPKNSKEKKEPEEEEITTPAPQKELSPTKTPKEKIIYDFLDDEDQIELQDILSDLKSKLLIFGTSELEEDDIRSIYNDLIKIASLLKLYPQTYTISNAIESLGNSMEDHTDEYIENSSSIAKLMAGFGNDLDLWFDSLFYSGTQDLHFLDDTIVSNTETIKQFAINQNDSGNEEEDLDSIFDF